MSNGEPYGPHHFKQLVKQLYIISKSCYTSYTDLLDITPAEKDILWACIDEENEARQQIIEKAKQKNSSSKGRR